MSALLSPGAATFCARRAHERRSCRRAPVAVAALAPSVGPSSLVLVAGATGGVGQIVTANLVALGYRVRAIVRNTSTATALFGSLPPGAQLEFVNADLRDAEALEGSGVCSGVDAVVCCTGTTAFPSSRWKGGNNPVATDALGVANLVAAVKAGSPSARFILCSSVGVLRTGAPPYSILNLFGVLTAKAAGEAALRASGLPYVVLRPARLTDGPYTSYDLNTLLRATSGERRAPRLALGDTLVAEQCSRLVVAAAAVAALQSPAALGRAFDVGSVEGPPVPAGDVAAWDALFVSAKRA